MDALAALLDEIGPAIVFVHSQSGPHGMGLVAERPDMVEALVNVEGQCTTAEDEDVSSAFTDAALLTVFGDFVAGDPFWEPIQQTCMEVVDAINEGGGTAFNMNLPQQGLIGNSHMLMMDKNNLAVADLILNWLDENVEATRGRH